LIRDEFTLD